MDYRRSVEVTVRDAVRNSLGLLVVSLLFSASLLPFSTTIFFSVPLAWVAGLWTTCLLAGVVTVAGFRLATEVAARHESISLAPLWRGFREDWLVGMAIGALTFGLLVVAILLFSVRLSGIAGQTINLFGVYLLIGWLLLLGFALPIYGRLTGPASATIPIGNLRFAFRAGLDAFVRNPGGAFWLLVQAAGWTFIAVVTIVTPVLFLPGFLVLLASEVTELTASWDELEMVAPEHVERFD
jgi:hypothetical protein